MADEMMDEINNDNGIKATPWFAQPKAKEMKRLEMPICEVCKKNKAIGVFCVPSVPIGCAYCEECYEANAYPWWILVSNTVCCGGLDKCADFWKWMVTNTCEHLEKSLDEFITDVRKSEDELAEYMREDYKKYCQKLFDECEIKIIDCKPNDCIKCHENGRMNYYKEYAGCGE